MAGFWHTLNVTSNFQRIPGYRQGIMWRWHAVELDFYSFLGRSIILHALPPSQYFGRHTTPCRSGAVCFASIGDGHSRAS